MLQIKRGIPLLFQGEKVATKKEEETRKRYAAYQMLTEAASACAVSGVAPQAVATLLADAYNNDPQALETMATHLGRAAHYMAREQE